MIFIYTSITVMMSCMLTGVLFWYARSSKMLDIPNARSSHSVPTPRGGGAAFVITFLAAMSWAYFRGLTDGALLAAVLIGGGSIALVGFFDDRRHVPSGYRLLVHSLAVTFAVFVLGRLPSVNFGIFEIRFGIAGTLLTIVYLVWFLNLYNFMDGIDGIASIEAICMMVTGMVLILVCHGNRDYIWPQIVLAAAVAGFLIWNWPPAKIFMGDVGSGFLGFVLGVIAIYTVFNEALPLWSWLIASGCFIVDASVTLVRRLCRGERIYQAHRSHAYQRLSRYWGGHTKVNMLLVLLNLVWLLPLAIASALWPKAGALLTIVALSPLAFGVWRLGGGVSGDLGHSGLSSGGHA